MSKMIGDVTTPFPGLTHQSQKGRNMVKLFFFFIHTKFVEIFTEISAVSLIPRGLKLHIHYSLFIHISIIPHLKHHIIQEYKHNIPNIHPLRSDIILILK
jgi:hypothetical protein